MIGVRHLDWMEFVWTSDIPSNAKLIAAYLSRYMNKNRDHAFPSLKTIEGETGLGHATVLKYLAALEGKEFLTRQKGGGRNNVTYYHVRFPSYVDEAIKQVNSRPNLIINRSADEHKQVGSCAETGRLPTPNQQGINNINHKEDNSENLPVSTRCPIKEIINKYHLILPELPRVQKITKTREGYIKQRWREDLTDLNQWGNFFRFVRNSDFLMGKIEPINGRRPFIADLEWLVRPSNFAKIAEDKYHG